MSNQQDERLEKIAQEQVFPQRYAGHKFPGEWPSDRHHAACLNLAQQILDNEIETAEAESEKKLAKAREKELEDKSYTASPTPTPSPAEIEEENELD